ncbi:MAG TPA: Amuc_1100 family pilus-like protein, partial [Chthoniobacterales bacterium]|nr:Amuc_1100 family pilus-like protein [Chthoniobacterales bacterium]
RLRQATAALADKARANRVKLPDNFYLGFEEFAASLPDTAAAPLLGQQLAQAEMLVNILLDSRVDALTSFRRVPAAEASLASAIATPTPAAARRPPAAQAPAAAAPLVERTVVEASFLSSPGAARRVINQVATANQQFYVIRTLHVLNEKDKGPPREGAGAPAASTPPPSTPGGAAPALNFIVGNERIQVTARIEMLRFSF